MEEGEIFMMRDIQPERNHPLLVGGMRIDIMTKEGDLKVTIERETEWRGTDMGQELILVPLLPGT